MKQILLIHGLDQKKINCLKIIKKIEKNNFCSFFSYKTSETIPEIVDRLHEYLQNMDEYYCITLSFGAIILRNYVHKYGVGNLKRAVMIAPPNKGSVLLQEVMKRKTGKLLFGKLAGDFLKNEDKYLPLEPEFDVGVIAGNKPHLFSSKAMTKYVLRFFDPEDSDGRVKVEETKLPFMKDYVLLNLSHTDMVYTDKAVDMAISYIENGKFTKKYE